MKVKPDATLLEVAEHVGKPAGKSTVSRTLLRLGLTRKKSRSTLPSRTDQTSPNGAAWHGNFVGRRAADLIFLDEFGANTKMHRTHGRGPRGERVVDKVPHGHFKSLSTIAALGTGGIVASESFGGGTTAARFVDFVRDRLVPVLRPGQVVVLDNLQAHKDKRVDVLLEAAGCVAPRLPPYSPDMNPIENAISKVKTILRQSGRRTVPGLFEAIRAALAQVTASDSRGFLTHCGYAATL